MDIGQATYDEDGNYFRGITLSKDLFSNRDAEVRVWDFEIFNK